MLIYSPRLCRFEALSRSRLHCDFWWTIAAIWSEVQVFKLPNLIPLVILAFIGLWAIIFGIGCGIWWLIQHVRFT